MTTRERYEQTELLILSEQATASTRSQGRALPEPECETRTCFQRDTDRVLHSKSFRRLKHKTQVFLSPEGDHYRTRLTHTLEVTRIGRTIARALHLNEDLVEAACLAHDLGHTPFGHAGEYALDEVMPGGFRHNEQSARVVETLEFGGTGLNLTVETVDAALHHTGSIEASTPEGRILKFADRIAYINHDIDDAVRAGVLPPNAVPRELAAVLGDSYSARINTMVSDVIANSGGSHVGMSDEIGGVMMALRDFMFEHVYYNPIAKSEESKARSMLLKLFEHYVAHPDALPHDHLHVVLREGAERAACDYVAGMTDKFAVAKFEELFVPRGWRTL